MQTIHTARSQGRQELDGGRLGEVGDCAHQVAERGLPGEPSGCPSKGPFLETPWGRAPGGPFFAAPLRYSHTS